MKNKYKISFVIPLRDEEKTLQTLSDKIAKECNNCPKISDFEIIFIDDGSTDDSVNELKKLKEENNFIKVIILRRKCGKSLALQAGFNIASGDLICTMDADLQDDPAEISNFITKMEEDYDVVSGWKFNRFDPKEKCLASKVFNFVTSSASGIKIHDFNCGFKLYRREVIEKLNMHSEMHRYMPVLAGFYGYKCTEIKVHHQKREFGVSKYGYGRYLNGLFDFMVVMYLMRYADRPLYFFGKIAIACSVLGFFGLFFNFICGIMLILSALFLLCFGLLAHIIVLGFMSKDRVNDYVKERI